MSLYDFYCQTMVFYKLTVLYYGEFPVSTNVRKA